MKKKYIVLVLILNSLFLLAQNIQRNSIGMSGATKEVTVNNTIYYVSQSIGQNSPIGSLINQNKTIRQGFQQSPISKSLLVGEEGILKASLFPNPTERTVNIVIHEKLQSNLEIQLFDNYGKLIKSKSLEYRKPTSIDFSNLSSPICSNSIFKFPLFILDKISYISFGAFVKRFVIPLLNSK